MTMADRIVVLRQGKIEQVGSPLELYDTPANVFVAGFIGSPAINLIEGRIRSAGSRSVLTLDDGAELPLPSPGPSHADDTRVVCGIRPEHIRFGTEGTRAVIDLIEPTGSDTQVHLRLGSTRLVGLSRLRLSEREGASVRIGFDPAGLHFFSCQTGQRLDAPLPVSGGAG
jgi:multiple sugar transport system ATP-binding protein